MKNQEIFPYYYQKHLTVTLFIDEKFKKWAKKTFLMIFLRAKLRVVQTQAILFLKSMSEKAGSDIERL